MNSAGSTHSRAPLTPATAQRLASWAVGLELRYVPTPVRAIARRCLVDTIGVAVGPEALVALLDLREPQLDVKHVGVLSEAGVMAG